MRELVTIGDLYARPLTRDRMRRQRSMGRFSGPSGWDIGQTNPGFAPGADSSSAGQELQDAAIALLNYLDANGVPSEHVRDANVLAFQTSWNADPANGAASAKLSLDGGYGTNTRDALAAMVGSVAPPVNTGGAPAPSPSPAPPSPHPSPAPIVPAAAGGSHLGLWLLLGAVALGGWLLMRKKKRGGGGHGRALVEVRSNPRRRRRRNALEGF
jgi:hypothetical protein